MWNFLFAAHVDLLLYEKKIVQVVTRRFLWLSKAGLDGVNKSTIN
jgi:hypothetical protein